MPCGDLTKRYIQKLMPSKCVRHFFSGVLLLQQAYETEGVRHYKYT
jgi:hypothetical protein